MHFTCLENTDNITKDVVITTVPWTDSEIPLMAPAQLKPIVESAGLTCLAVDANAEVYAWSKEHPNKKQLLDFFFDGRIHDDVVGKEIFEVFESLARQILSFKPKFVGLSLLTFACKNSAKWLSWIIKKIDPSVTIILGGAGCLVNFTGSSKFVDDLLAGGIIDFHIRGDGERSLYEFLVGNKEYSGINSLSWDQLPMEEVRQLPLPNYDDYDFSYYAKRVLPLLGSRGCVRRCTFCDVEANWKKFQWRTAEDIFGEMQLQYEKYGIRYFKFQDSLTNGNLKDFNKLTEILSEYNLSNPEKSFKWAGFYIFREHNKNTSREWQYIADSGADLLSVGIENLNQHIRYALGKKFSNEAIDVHLEHALKHKVTCNLLNIVGYVNETQEDIDSIKRWLDTHTKYKEVIRINWGGTLGIFPNTWLDANKDKLGIKMLDNSLLPDPNAWVNESIGSTPQVRANWAIDLHKHATDLGYNVYMMQDNHYVLESLIDDELLF